jgi:hypothetical protein
MIPDRRPKKMSRVPALTAWGALLLAAAAVTSAQPAGEMFLVTGTVYSAQRLAPGDPAPVTPFKDPQLVQDPNSPPHHRVVHSKFVGGENLFPVNPKGMVQVSLEDAGSGARLVETLTFNGVFWLEFSAPLQILAPPGNVVPRPVVVGSPPRRVTERSVRFVVRDAATGELLLRSRPVPIWAGANERFLLVESEPTEIGNRTPPLSGGDFLFTRVGKIESDLIGLDGRANVPPARAAQLHLPAFADAPFGGVLYFFGAFGSQYYDGSHCYQLLIDKQPLTSPLTKTRYETAPGAAKVKAEVRHLEDAQGWGVDHCYQLTPMGQAGVFWSFPDLLAVWPTTGLASAVDKSIEVKLHEKCPPGSSPQQCPNGKSVEVTLDPGFLIGGDPNRDLTKLVLDVDNQPVMLGFDAILQKSSGADLLKDACQIVQLGANDEIEVRFQAAHPALLEWSLAVRSNSGVSAGTASWSYAGTDPAPAPHVHKLPASAFGDPCAYAFSLYARARTTDGYGYLNWANRLQTYYVTP